MAAERTQTEIDYLIKDIENFVESLKNDENPYNPRFGPTIEYLEGSIVNIDQVQKIFYHKEKV